MANQITCNPDAKFNGNVIQQSRKKNYSLDKNAVHSPTLLLSDTVSQAVETVQTRAVVPYIEPRSEEAKNGKKVAISGNMGAYLICTFARRERLKEDRSAPKSNS